MKLARHVQILKLGSTYPMAVAEVGDYEVWFQHRLRELEVLPSLELSIHDITQGAAPTGLPDALILTGSPHSVYEPLAWIAVATDYVKKAIARGVPILGVCFGHQLIAQALGGRVGPTPGGWGLGTAEVTLSPSGRQDPLFAGFPNVFAVQRSHRDVVLEIPPGAEILATTGLDPHHALRVRERVWTVQYHPEMRHIEMGAEVACRAPTLHREGLERGLAPGEFVMRTLAGIQETPQSSQLLSRFVELAL